LSRGPAHAPRLSIILLCATSITICPVMSIGHTTEVKRPILLGQLVSLTGNNPGGKDNAQGAALAVAELNAAGGLLGGRPIELRAEDDQTSVAGAIAGFERLVKLGVSAIVGTSFSNASLAVIPSAERARIPYVSTGAADAQVDPVRTYAYMTPLTGRLVAEQLLRYMQSKGITQLAVIYDSDSQFATDGWAKQQRMLPRYGIQLATEQPVRVDTADFGPVLAAISAARPQAIMGWLTGPPAIGFVKAYGESAVRVPLYMSHGVASPAFLGTVGAAADGVTVAVPLAMVAAQLPESPIRSAGLEMTRSFEHTYGRAPSLFAVDGYVAVRLIAAAIERAGSGDPIAIRHALDHLTLATPEGEYRYSPKDHSGLAVDAVAVAEVRAGRFELTQWSRAQQEGVRP
jgi:branched-chain amino acid transport system substrate-binding protein